MERKKISIIVPCYNVTDYVDRFMSSLLNQTLDNGFYEIIAVNDASTDDTFDKLNEWKSKYPDNIKVITYEKNIRQGGARNKGIKMANGDYIGFLDADDWIEPNALEEMYKVIQDHKYDMIMGLFSEDNDYNVIYDGLHDYSSRNDSEIKFGRNMDSIESRIDFSIGYIWNAIYRKDIIIDNELWYPENIAYEDIYWINLIKLYIDDVYVVDMITHHHYYNKDSTLNKKNAVHHLDRLVSYELLLDKYYELGLLEHCFDILLKQTMEIYVINSYFMFFTRMDDIPDVYNRIKRTIETYFPGWRGRYDENILPLPYNYLVSFLKKSKVAAPEQLQVFKDAVLEIINNNI